SFLWSRGFLYRQGSTALRTQYGIEASCKPHRGILQPCSKSIADGSCIWGSLVRVAFHRQCPCPKVPVLWKWHRLPYPCEKHLHPPGCSRFSAMPFPMVVFFCV